MIRQHVEITGRVQGVGFRWFVRQHARALGLAGWVKNHESGAVHLAVEGADDVVRRFLEVISPGPPGARVDAIRPLPAEGIGDLPDTFTVLR